MNQIHPDLLTLAQPVGSLSNLPGNPRRGDVDAVARSYEAFGQRKPIVARRADRVVLAGNHQLLAARQLGWSEIAVVFVDDDELTGNAFALADNKTSDLGEYDVDDLLAMLHSVHAEATADLFAATGFQQAEILAMIAAATPRVAHTDPDDTPAPPTVPFSQLGDVWTLGDHVLVCGDATDPAVRTTGEQPRIVFTDPPYGIAYMAIRSSMQGHALANDATLAAAETVLAAALMFSTDVEAHFVCCDWRSLPSTLAAFAVAGITPKACIVWDKGHPAQHLDRYGKAHEFIVYAGPYGGQPTQATDVWSHHREYRDDHPTPKPVALIRQALETSTAPGDLVLDPFAGSGSTLIAAHGLGRRARLVELDPIYVDVICRRFQEHTGILPVLERTGETHDFTQ